MADPVITERDKERIRQLGRWIAEANADSLRQHLSRSHAEKLAVSEQLSRRARGWVNVGDRKDDEPWKLLDRSRALGRIT